MGSGTYTACSFNDYSHSMGRSVDVVTGRVSNHQYTARTLKSEMNPHDTIRECCNSEEHPNTVPVILALDVTGSMGAACDEVAATLSQIVKDLYEKFKDVEILIMGIGDFECDDYPLQVSQFESDVRIIKSLDNLYLERGGGGNSYESYTAAWWYGLYRTKLDCYDDQGLKGVIITMGDEPLNPKLPPEMLDYVGHSTNKTRQTEYIFDTKKLYQAAKDKFEIYHIAVDDKQDSFNSYEKEIERTFKHTLGDNYKVSTINGLKNCICDCISESIKARESFIHDVTEAPFMEPATIGEPLKRDENGGIIW